MITPGTWDTELPQGATWDITLTWAIDGSPVNLTGYSARLQLREQYNSATASLSLTSGSGLTLGGALGTIRIQVSATATAALEARRYKYDLELVSGGGEVTRLLEGDLEVTPEVTR